MNEQEKEGQEKLMRQVVAEGEQHVRIAVFEGDYFDGQEKELGRWGLVPRLEYVLADAKTATGRVLTYRFKKLAVDSKTGEIKAVYRFEEDRPLPQNPDFPSILGVWTQRRQK